MTDATMQQGVNVQRVLAFEAVPAFVLTESGVLTLLSETRSCRRWSRLVDTLQAALQDAVLLQLLTSEAAERIRSILAGGTTSHAWGAVLLCQREVLRHFTDCGVSPHPN